MARSKIVEVECRLVKQTDKAYLIDAGGEDPVWIPRSMIEDEGVEPDGSLYSIFIPEWLAQEEGLI
jgi:hypothetical protein